MKCRQNPNKFLGITFYGEHKWKTTALVKGSLWYDVYFECERCGVAHNEWGVDESKIAMVFPDWKLVKDYFDSKGSLYDTWLGGDKLKNLLEGKPYNDGGES